MSKPTLPSEDANHRIEDVVDYVDEALGPAARAEFAAHLAICPGCQKGEARWRRAAPHVNAGALQEFKFLHTVEEQVARFEALAAERAQGGPAEAEARATEVRSPSATPPIAVLGEVKPLPRGSAARRPRWARRVAIGLAACAMVALAIFALDLYLQSHDPNQGRLYAPVNPNAPPTPAPDAG